MTNGWTSLRLWRSTTFTSSQANHLRRSCPSANRSAGPSGDPGSACVPYPIASAPVMGPRLGGTCGRSSIEHTLLSAAPDAIGDVDRPGARCRLGSARPHDQDLALRRRRRRQAPSTRCSPWTIVGGRSPSLFAGTITFTDTALSGARYQGVPSPAPGEPMQGVTTRRQPLDERQREARIAEPRRRLGVV